MPKFAIYYVPKAEDEFYNLGSSILGYDIRAQKSTQFSADLKTNLEEFDQVWVEAARPYGFHLTIGDSIDFNFSEIKHIENGLIEIIECFDPNRPFILKQYSQDLIPDWGRIVVLRYDPNDDLKLFHALVVALINTLGIGSGYLEAYIKDQEIYREEHHKAKRVLKFYSPFILSNYLPHFTLLNPYTGNDREKIIRVFSEKFRPFSEITVESISLVVQIHENDNWVIYKEFQR